MAQDKAIQGVERRPRRAAEKDPTTDLVTARRTAEVLLAFAGQNGDLGISEVARRLSLAKSVTYRIVRTLVSTGLLDRDDERSRYRLGPRAAELGLAAIGNSDPRAMALPVMTELAGRTRETVTMSLRVGVERVYVSQVESLQDVHMSVEIGKRFPLYAGASGRAILAFLPPDKSERYLARTPLVPLADGTITDPSALTDSLWKDARARLRGQLRGTRRMGSFCGCADFAGRLCNRLA